MMKTFISILICCSTFHLLAAEKTWKLKGMIGVTYSETNVSSNWSGGEQDARTWIAKLDASAEKIYTKSSSEATRY